MQPRFAIWWYFVETTSRLPLSPPALFDRREDTIHLKDPDQVYRQEGGFRVCPSTFSTCKDTQHKRASPVNHFKFSPCYDWNKTQIPHTVFSVLISSLCSRSLPAILASWLFLKHAKCVLTSRLWYLLFPLPGMLFPPYLPGLLLHSFRSLFKHHLLREAFHDYTH